MDPGGVTEQLQRLTQVEEMLITLAFPIMRAYPLVGGGGVMGATLSTSPRMSGIPVHGGRSMPLTSPIYLPPMMTCSSRYSRRPRKTLSGDDTGRIVPYFGSGRPIPSITTSRLKRVRWLCRQMTVGHRPGFAQTVEPLAAQETATDTRPDQRRASRGLHYFEPSLPRKTAEGGLEDTAIEAMR